jgi:hypothetical protein
MVVGQLSHDGIGRQFRQFRGSGERPAQGHNTGGPRAGDARVKSLPADVSSTAPRPYQVRRADA